MIIPRNKFSEIKKMVGFAFNEQLSTTITPTHCLSANDLTFKHAEKPGRSSIPLNTYFSEHASYDTRLLFETMVLIARGTQQPMPFYKQGVTHHDLINLDKIIDMRLTERMLHSRLSAFDWNSKHCKKPEDFEHRKGEYYFIEKQLMKFCNSQYGIAGANAIWNLHAPKGFKKPDFLATYNYPTFKQENAEVLKQQFKRAGFKKAFNQELMQKLSQGHDRIEHFFNQHYGKDIVEALIHIRKRSRDDSYYLHSFDISVFKKGLKKPIKESFNFSSEHPAYRFLVEKPAAMTLRKAYNLLDGRPIVFTRAIIDKTPVQLYEMIDFKKSFDLAKTGYERSYFYTSATEVLGILNKYSIEDLNTSLQTRQLLKSFERGNLTRVNFKDQSGKKENLLIALDLSAGKLKIYSMAGEKIKPEILVRKNYIQHPTDRFQKQDRLIPKPVNYLQVAKNFIGKVRQKLQ